MHGDTTLWKAEGKGAGRHDSRARLAVQLPSSSSQTCQFEAMLSYLPSCNLEHDKKGKAGESESHLVMQQRHLCWTKHCNNGVGLKVNPDNQASKE